MLKAKKAKYIDIHMPVKIPIKTLAFFRTTLYPLLVKEEEMVKIPFGNGDKQLPVKILWNVKMSNRCQLQVTNK